MQVTIKLINRPVHALRSIMGNQGKIAKKQSGKIHVYLHISILRFIFERKLSVFFESIELGISLLTRVTETLFLWFDRLRLDRISRF